MNFSPRIFYLQKWAVYLIRYGYPFYHCDNSGPNIASPSYTCLTYVIRVQNVLLDSKLKKRSSPQKMLQTQHSLQLFLYFIIQDSIQECHTIHSYADDNMLQT